MLASDSAAARSLPPAVPGALPMRTGRVGRRGPDRRTAFADFLAFVSGGLSPDRDPRELRIRFEDGLRRLLSVRSVSVMDVAPAPPPTPSPHICTLELPGGYDDDRPVIHIVGDPRTPPDEWDLQMMHTVRYIAAFVLAVERRRGVSRGRTDGTMALVGSSALVKGLCERIARVASSDFTVLIEGPIGR